MKLYSTNNPENIVGLRQAVMKSLADDKGLYMPINIPKMNPSFLQDLESYSFEEIAFEVSKNLFGNYIPNRRLRSICEESINFKAPVKPLMDQISTLELFHGPSLAFKDFGARYMAQLMSYFNEGSDEKLTILVATSGDTGGAVAAGFLETSGIEVIILYPSGRVSDLQEKQLTTLGHNIYAVEVDGSFDDCQAMVKTAFLDKDLYSRYNLSSANSINIARLIPQSFYYFEAMKQLDPLKGQVFCVPSGNFGNLTAGLIAKQMGLPIKEFIAATNINNVVPEYLHSGFYKPQVSKATISNAMDVGSPSNFTRMQHLFGQDVNRMRNQVKGYFYNDHQTLDGLKELFDKTGYVADPHGAIGYLAAKDYLIKNGEGTHVTFLETAHPAKFIDTVSGVLRKEIEVPTRLKELEELSKVATMLSNEYEEFKAYLLRR